MIIDFTHDIETAQFVDAAEFALWKSDKPIIVTDGAMVSGVMYFSIKPMIPEQQNVNKISGFLIELLQTRVSNDKLKDGGHTNGTLDRAHPNLPFLSFLCFSDIVRPTILIKSLRALELRQGQDREGWCQEGERPSLDNGQPEIIAISRIWKIQVQNKLSVPASKSGL